MREAVIVSTARTPIGKAYRGAFNDTPAPTLGGHAIAAALGRAHVAADEVDDVVMGAAMQQGWRCQSNGALSTRSATWALSRWRLLLVNRAKRSSAADRKINGLESSSVVLDPSKIRYSWPT